MWLCCNSFRFSVLAISQGRLRPVAKVRRSGQPQARMRHIADIAWPKHLFLWSRWHAGRSSPKFQFNHDNVLVFLKGLTNAALSTTRTYADYFRTTPPFLLGFP